MASLSSALNVYNTCLLILRRRGYELWIKEINPETIMWFAKKKEYDFAAYSPIELLGLVSIYEYQKPQISPVDYWWRVEGENDELLEQFINRQQSRAD